MRSSEASGAGANGFRVGRGMIGEPPGSASGERDVPHPWHHRFSPVTTAVALTAFLAATLFIIYDTAKTFDDARRELGMIGAMVVAEIAHRSPDTVRAAIDSSVSRFGSVARASLVAEPDATPRPFSRVIPAGPHGNLALDLEESGALAGIAGRGAAAFGLAGLVTLLTLRRRRLTEMPDMLQRHNYRTLAAAIPMGVACWTGSGKLIVCNDRYKDRLDIAGGDITYHQAVSRLIAGGYMKLVREDDTSRLLELHRDDGSCLLIDERPLGDGGFMTLVTDVTERKRTDSLLVAIREEQRQLARRYHEEKLKAEAASRSKTNFLAHLSHDIRTPLNHIIGFAELMKHETYGPLGDPRYADYVQSIKSSGEHLLASFATILDLAELESGQKALRQDPVPVDEIIDSVARRFKSQIQRAGLTLAVGQNCGAVLRGDRLGLVRMVGNIVENSVRFTPAGGVITLAAYAADNGVVIEITDTGIGMSEDRLESLSQPFALGDATFTREGIGPGLGISIARAIAELSGGNLAIDSSPSLGTTVAISLPLESMASTMVAAE